MATFKTKKSAIRTFKPKPRMVPKGAHVMTIESLNEDGRGVARVKGKTVFVSGALSGEEVKATYTASRKNYDEAYSVSIITASSARIQPTCEYSDNCGGCSFQYLAYQDQITHKQGNLYRKFKTMLPSTTERLPEPIIGDSLHYRHRAKLMVKANKNGCSLGFRKKQSHELININHCSILYPSLSKKLPLFKSLIGSLSSRSLVIDLIVCEDSNQRIALKLICKKPLSDEDIGDLIQAAKHNDLYIEVALANKSTGRVIWQSNEQNFEYRLDNHLVTLPYQLNDFTQVNPLVNEQIIACALDWLNLNKDDLLADYFCGLGNFSLPMSRHVSQVIGYEISASMVDKAGLSAKANKITNAQFVVSDLLGEDYSIKGMPTKILLDPPRSGAESLSKKLSECGAERIVYISCNPSTLLRDARLLTENNYKLERIRLADMFPQTNHSEVIALFTLIA